MLELLILCLFVAGVAWLVGIIVAAARTGAVAAEPIVLLVAATLLVLLGASVPLFFGGIGAQAATVLVLAFGGALLLRVGRS